MCGLERSPDNSLMVTCGDEVVVVAVHSVATVNDAVTADDDAVNDDVVEADSVAVAVGASTTVIVWVQQCWMRACANPQSHLVSVVVTLRGKKLSWWYRQTTQGPHSTMGRLVCCQPCC